MKSEGMFTSLRMAWFINMEYDIQFIVGSHKPHEKEENKVVMDILYRTIINTNVQIKSRCLAI